MITIDEYLTLSDWQFARIVDIGRFEQFYWIEFRHDFNFIDYVPLPDKPFSLYVLSFDSGPAAPVYGDKRSWRSVGSGALSDYNNKIQVIDQADTEFAIIQNPISDEELVVLSQNLSYADFHDSKFWEELRLLDPYCYISLTDKFFLATRQEDILATLQSERVTQALEQSHREIETKHRADKWNTLGPDCGPEKCIVEGCERLRIKLAVKCFAHQILF